MKVIASLVGFLAIAVAAAAAPSPVGRPPLPCLRVRTLTGDPRIFGRVYIGTDGRGILFGEPTASKALR